MKLAPLGAAGGVSALCLSWSSALLGSPTAGEEREAVAPSELAVASYALSAKLDTDLHSVDGEGTLSWINRSGAATSELYFHLYLNAFKNPQSLFLRSAFQRARSGVRPRRPGSIVLTRLYAHELGRDLLPELEPHSPGDPEDETDRRLPLPRAIEPGERLTLDLAWRSVLPDLVERTGVSRDFYLVAQWFPKLARLEPDGTWAHFAFHPHAEFYADYGDYDVELDIPERWLGAATGQPTSELRAEGRRKLRYQARAVHDFAWTAWPHFQRHVDRVGEIEVELLLPPGHDRNRDVTLQTLRFALPYFQERYGEYPHPRLTVVHPPRHAPSAGGMEYPMFITTGGSWHVSWWSRALENVTVHELGHQWFYGLIASNEERWPFLDEGLNTYAESDALSAQYAEGSAAELFGWKLSNPAAHRLFMTLEPLDLPIARAARDFKSFRQLGAVVYSKTGLLLRTLGNVYGREKLAQALAHYTARQRFAHPDPGDLRAALSEGLGPEADANWQSALEGGRVNYELRDLRVRQLSSDQSGGQPAHESRFIAYRHGELVFPVEIRFTTADGRQFSEHWDGAGQSREVVHQDQSPIISAAIDPARRVEIEEDLLDNGLRTERQLPLRLFDRLLFWGQLLLGALEP